MNKAIIFFHAQCMDGYASAYCAYERLEVRNKQDCTFVPCAPGTVFSIPDIKEATDIVFADITPQYSQLETLLNDELVKTIAVIDHHDIDKRIVDDGKKLCLVYDKKKSACVLACEYFRCFDDLVPTHFLYIQDRDTWQWKLDNTKEVNEGLFKNLSSSIPTSRMNQEQIRKSFAKMRELLNVPIEKLCEEGKTSLQFTRESIDMLCRSGEECTFKAEGKMYKVWCVCTRAFRSEVGAALLQKKWGKEKEDPDFSVCWHYDIKNDEFWLALRSEDSKVSVAEIARMFGGNGHRNAAGITFSYNLFKDVIKRV